MQAEGDALVVSAGCEPAELRLVGTRDVGLAAQLTDPAQGGIDVGNLKAEHAVVGFDNREVMATGARPPLTTVDLNLLKLGLQAATKLLAAIGGDDVRGTEKYPCELVVRQSTGVPSRAGEAPPRTAVTASKAPAAD